MNFQLNYKYFTLIVTDLNFYFIRLFDKNFSNHLFFRKYLKVIIFYIIDVKFTPFSLILFRESICNFNLTYDIEFFSSANIFFFFALYLSSLKLFVFLINYESELSLLIKYSQKFLASYHRETGGRKKLSWSKIRNMKKKTVSIFLKILNN